MKTQFRLILIATLIAAIIINLLIPPVAQAAPTQPTVVDQGAHLTAAEYTIAVTTLDDEWSIDANKASSKCSLREALQAILQALHGDQGCKTYPTGPKVVTLTLLPGTYKLTRPEPLPTIIDAEVSIDGHNAVIIDGNAGVKPQVAKGVCQMTFDPNQFKRKEGIFQVSAGARLNLANLTLQQGVRGAGGAIMNFGTLFLHEVTLQHNFAYNAGNYTTSGGAISSQGTLTAIRSTFVENWAYRGGALEANGVSNLEEITFRGNRAYRDGGALISSSGAQQVHLLQAKFQENCVFNDNFGPSYDYTSDAHWGGALANSGGTLLVEESLFKDNWVTYGKGGGAIYNGATLTLINSVITRNYSNSESQWHITFGGGLINQGNLVMQGVSIHNNRGQYGGALFNLGPGKIEMGNSTISQNRAVQAGGIANGWSLQNAGEIRLYHTTIANNSEEESLDGVPAKGALAIQSTQEQSVYAGNSIISGQDGSACFKSIYTLGSNIAGGACPMVSTDPNVTPSKVVSGMKEIQLFPLGNDGGPPVEDYYTHPLFDQSVAVDVGNDANCNHFLVAGKDQIDQARQGPCDAGALEAGVNPPVYEADPSSRVDFPFLKLAPGGPLFVEAALTLKNSGSGYITYQAAIDESWNNTFALMGKAKGTLFKNDTAKLMLRCTPAAPGIYYGTVLVKTNIPGATEQYYKLKCSAFGANTPAADPSQQPGKINKKGGVNEDTLVSFTLNNPGDQPLSATPNFSTQQAGAMSFNAQGAAVVAATQTGANAAYAIPPGGTLAMSVKCTPPGPGVYVGVLNITTNDPLNPTLDYEIACEGAYPTLPEGLLPGNFYLHLAPNKGFAGLALHPKGTELLAGTAALNDLFLYSRNPSDGSLSSKGSLDLGGMGRIQDLAYSPDGNSAYAASRDGDGVLVLHRGNSGELSISQVMTRTTLYVCGRLKFCMLNGMDGASALDVSPDGKNLYVVGQFDDTLTVFQRNSQTGQIAMMQQFTRTVAGTNVLGSPTGVAVSPDNQHVYVLAAEDHAIAIFAREANGRLRYQTALFNGQMGVTGLTMPTDLAFSADGKQVFVTARLDNTVSFFKRSPADGGLKLIQSLTGITGAAGIAVSETGEARRVFVAAQDGDAILTLAYDPLVNRLILVDTDTNAAAPNLDEPVQLAVSADGLHLYAALWQGGGVRHLRTIKHKPGVGPISPASAVAGSGAFTLTVNGARFYPGAQVLWNGNALGTTFVNDRQLQATVSASDIAAAGEVPLLVRNSGPGGGDSNPAAFVVTTPDAPPVPSIESLNPPAAEWGSADTTLTVKGQNFTPQSQAQLNGKAVQTFYVNATTLLVFISAADLQEPGALGLTVVNSAGVDAAGVSAAATSPVFPFITSAPGQATLPAISRLAPSASTSTGMALWVTVLGSNFSQGAYVNGAYGASQAYWDGQPRPTLVATPNQLALELSPTDLATPGHHQITVVTPGAGESNNATFTVLAPGENPTPQLASYFLEPENGQWRLTVNGSELVAGLQVRWNEVALPATLIDETRASALLSAAQVTSGGSLAVVNPGPGGGLSNELVAAPRPNRPLYLPLIRNAQSTAAVTASATAETADLLVSAEPATASVPVNSNSALYLPLVQQSAP